MTKIDGSKIQPEDWESCNELFSGSDYYTVRALRLVLDAVAAKHGEDSLVRFDAGYNSVDMEVCASNTFADKVKTRRELARKDAERAKEKRRVEYERLKRDYWPT